MEFDELDEDNREFFMADVYDEMQNHGYIVEYCLAALQELLEEEFENDREDQAVLERFVQRRVAASLAARQ